MWLADDTTPARVAPTHVYRWERDEGSYDEDGGMVLRPDDERPQFAARVALYWRDSDCTEWYWLAYRPFRDGGCATADAARRACELAVLHGEAHDGA